MGDHWRPRTEGEFVANFWRRVLFANGDACWVWTWKHVDSDQQGGKAVRP